MATSHLPFLLGDLLLKSAIIILIASVLAFCLTRASAAVRHFVWAVTFVALAYLPILAIGLPPNEFEGWPKFTAAPTVSNPPPASHGVVFIPQAPHWAATAGAQHSSVENVPAGPISPVAAIPNVPPLAHPAPGLIGAFALLAIWAAGVLLGIARFVAARRSLRSLARDARTVSDASIRAQVEAMTKASVVVLQGAEQTADLSPMTWGFKRRVILLPFGAQDWTQERLRAVLAHELAHVDRRDWIRQSMASCVAILYWPNPLVWWALRQMVHESERACDDRVIAAGIAPTDYAGELVAIVRNLRHRQVSGAVSMVRRSHIESRLRAILSATVNRAPASFQVTGVIVLVFFAVVVPLSAISKPRNNLDYIIKHINWTENTPAERDAAIRRLSAALRQSGDGNPRAALAHSLLGGWEASDGRNMEALIDYDAALRLPENGTHDLHLDAQRQRVSVLLALNRYAEAADASEQLAQMPGVTVGDVLEARRDAKTYRRQEAIKQDGGASDALKRYRAYHAAKKTDPTGALNYDDLVLLANDLSMASMNAQAAIVYADLLNRYPNAPNAANTAMQKLFAVNSVSPDAIAKIMARYPSAANDANIIANLGSAYEQSGNSQKAIPIYRHVFDLNDKNSSPNAGMSYIRLVSQTGDQVKANAAADELIRRFPESQEAKQLIEARNPPLNPSAPGTHIPTDGIVHAPGGVTIELLKVATSPHGPRWLPDGTRLPAESKGDDGFIASPNSIGYLLRVTGQADTRRSPIMMGSSSSEVIGTWASSTGNPKEEWYGETRLLTIPERTNFRFSVLSGPWSTAAVIPAPKPGAEEVEANGCVVDFAGPKTAPHGPDNKKIWALTDHLGEMERSLIVVDRSGRMTTLETSGSMWDEKTATSWFQVPKIAPSDIREIHVETRPYYKVEFRDIHLRPNPT
ncbi:hypothetical protein CCAX7_57520 [Capsulimonas corticalis]|uniref:Uncharacterized protein n=1 Tax=Capsulimonas corticalis TaxID=2219043 RepID=A0A402D0D5_9BACT|nr:M56 family metallopeptidase [Capsulimonas corticalis]BDI33701.1 hypothetical protein CCAX7_57520 [Capsulimonas corticalis]